MTTVAPAGQRRRCAVVYNPTKISDQFRALLEDRLLSMGWVRRKAMLCVVGNVGKLRANLTLIPGARPDDGVLDLYIASPRRFRHWVKLALRLIARRPRRDDQVDQHSGIRVGIRIDGKDNYQLDGDIVGESTNLTAEIQPGALTVCAPTPVSGTPHR